MRDPTRIDQVLAVVREIWKQYPDLRLGQLLVNAVQPSEPCSEVYSVEDSVLVRKLESLAKRWRDRNGTTTLRGMDWTTQSTAAGDPL